MYIKLLFTPFSWSFSVRQKLMNYFHKTTTGILEATKLSVEQIFKSINDAAWIWQNNLFIWE